MMRRGRFFVLTLKRLCILCGLMMVCPERFFQELCGSFSGTFVICRHLSCMLSSRLKSGLFLQKVFRDESRTGTPEKRTAAISKKY